MESAPRKRKKPAVSSEGKQRKRPRSSPESLASLQSTTEGSIQHGNGSSTESPLVLRSKDRLHWGSSSTKVTNLGHRDREGRMNRPMVPADYTSIGSTQHRSEVTNSYTKKSLEKLLGSKIPRGKPGDKVQIANAAKHSRSILSPQSPQVYHPPPSEEIPRPHPRSKSPSKGFCIIIDDNIERPKPPMSLPDVSDPIARLRVARLLQIAPNVPIRDLHRILYEHDGDYDAALVVVCALNREIHEKIHDQLEAKHAQRQVQAQSPPQPHPRPPQPRARSIPTPTIPEPIPEIDLSFGEIKEEEDLIKPEFDYDEIAMDLNEAAEMRFYRYYSPVKPPKKPAKKTKTAKKAAKPKAAPKSKKSEKAKPRKPKKDLKVSKPGVEQSGGEEAVSPGPATRTRARKKPQNTVTPQTGRKRACSPEKSVSVSPLAPRSGGRRSSSSDSGGFIEPDDDAHDVASTASFHTSSESYSSDSEVSDEDLREDIQWHEDVNTRI